MTDLSLNSILDGIIETYRTVNRRRPLVAIKKLKSFIETYKNNTEIISGFVAGISDINRQILGYPGSYWKKLEENLETLIAKQSVVVSLSNALKSKGIDPRVFFYNAGRLPPNLLVVYLEQARESVELFYEDDRINNYLFGGGLLGMTLIKYSASQRRHIF